MSDPDIDWDATDDDYEDEERDYKCLPIFKHFKPETVKALVAQPWESGSELPVEFKEIGIELTERDLAVHDLTTYTSVCPLAWCLAYEKKAWTFLDEDHHVWGFNSMPSSNEVARQLLGLSPGEIPPLEKSGDFLTLEQEAAEFIDPWDSGKVELAEAACVHPEPEEVNEPVAV